MLVSEASVAPLMTFMVVCIKFNAYQTPAEVSVCFEGVETYELSYDLAQSVCPERLDKKFLSLLLNFLSNYPFTM